MESIGTAPIRRLSDSKLTVKHPDEDVRGRKVLDKAGEDIGTVDELFIDDRESKVRFLRVEAGGVLGIGAKVVLITGRRDYPGHRYRRPHRPEQ